MAALVSSLLYIGKIMDKIWIISSTGLIFFLISVGYLLFPKKIQSFGADIYSDGKAIAKINPLKEWMKSSSYIISLRLIGVMSLFVVFLMIYLLLNE